MHRAVGGEGHDYLGEGLNLALLHFRLLSFKRELCNEQLCI